MSTSHLCFCILGIFSATVACSGTVTSLGDDPNSLEESAGSAGSSSNAAVEGLPCKYLHGTATLSSYDGDNYASSAFSFEYASQDVDVTHNEFDVLYSGDMFIVNMVTDDRSFLVDLGDVTWEQVPAWAQADDYPVGQWGEHDALQAQFHHTYFVRSEDGAGRGVAAFRVIGLEPGFRATIEWVRSTSTDQMVLPSACGL